MVIGRPFGVTTRPGQLMLVHSCFICVRDEGAIKAQESIASIPGPTGRSVLPGWLTSRLVYAMT